ncbi:MAG: Xaa-Pro peptidase family protein [Anaerolineae bacterium]|nr:Xaa-Pro peptidase family protein [Anaerolineae bacterium]
MRIGKLRQILTENNLDAFFVSDVTNERYLAGFTGSPGDAGLVISQDLALIVTDSRYWEQVQRECPDFELVKVTTKFDAVLPEILQRVGGKRIGFEADHITVAQYERWMKPFGQVEWVATNEWVRRLRAVKDAEEIALIRQAVALADEALAHGLQHIRPGMTERELAWIMEVYMRTHGAEGTSFDFIVAAGPNGAMAHYRAADVPLPMGQPIVIDMGAKLNGYCSDLTRTVCLGEPAEPQRFWEIYQAVLAAQQKAEAEIRAGMSGVEADAIARRVIVEAGYGEQFGHGLGHGVGLEVHEKPRVSYISEDTLAAGNLITVEPGIYITGWGGVRIEDIVLVTDDGVEVLTRSPKEPIIYGDW